eukprot:5521064-Pyramimonas_sp.AAC.1
MATREIATAGFSTWSASGSRSLAPGPPRYGSGRKAGPMEGQPRRDRARRFFCAPSRQQPGKIVYWILDARQTAAVTA